MENNIKTENQQFSAEERLITKDFIADLKKGRLFCIIKNLVLIAIFVAASIFVSKSILLTLALIIIFIIVRKFVQIGATMKHEYFNTISRTFEIGDLSVLGFLVGLVVVYAIFSGINWLNETLFPPYFFIFELIVVAGVGLWLFFPLLFDIYFIIESSVFIKNPPKEEVFVMSDYLKEGSVAKFKKNAKRVIVGACLTALVGAVIVQTVQYFIESPKLLAELDREKAYASYSEQKLKVNVPKEEFENPDKREYKRFKAKCIDTYIFETDNGGFKTENTVTVTYNYDGGWMVTDYDAETSVISIDMSGKWTGVGKDAYFGNEECQFTVVIDKMTKTEAVGSITVINPLESENNEYHAKFTGTVEHVVHTDKYEERHIYYVIKATAEEARSWGDDQIVFDYHVGSDTINVLHNYEALLTREK